MIEAIEGGIVTIEALTRIEIYMSTIEQIKTTILTLVPEEFPQLRQWFSDVDYLRWDEQLKRDVAEGKLDALAEEAIADFKLNADL